MAQVRIKDNEDLKKWLNGLPEEQGRSAAVAIAARAALRAFPALETWLIRNEGKAISFVLPACRALTASWLAEGGRRDIKIIKAAALAAEAAIRTATATFTTAAAYNAASAAAATTSFAAAADAVATADSAVAAIATATFGANNDVALTASIAARKAIEIDSNVIANGTSIPDLMNTPLWPDGTPEWAQKLWRAMKARLLAREGEHWEVWTNWYDARLDPSRPIPCYSPPDTKLERARALLPENLWEQGSTEVNKKIHSFMDTQS